MPGNAQQWSYDTSSLDRNQPLTPSFQSPMFFPVPVSSLPSELCPTVQRFNATVPNFHFNVLSVVAATSQNRKVAMILHYCAHEICVPAAGVPPAEHENAKTQSTETGKNENAKTRKRRKRENGENTIHFVGFWTWTLSQLWACVKYVPKQSIA